MSEVIRLGDVSISVTRKEVKNVHLSVHPPDGRVTLVAPRTTGLDVARAYAASKLGWIRKQQQQLAAQVREEPRRLVTRESHYVWGRRHLLRVVERAEKPSIALSPRRLVLTVRPGSSLSKREEVLHAWHKTLLHAAIPRIISKWERKLGVKSSGYFLRRMKTKWGSCNHRERTIRLNTELVKKPKDLLEYVVVHELTHLIAPTHSAKFLRLMDKHYPSWREARQELNTLPLAVANWIQDDP